MTRRLLTLCFAFALSLGAQGMRATSHNSGNSSTISISWPTGTVSGDLAIVCGGGAWGASSASTPGGFGGIFDFRSSSFYNGRCMSKVLTSGDISTGSVSWGLQGSLDWTAVCITFVGSPATILRTSAVNQNPATASLVVSVGSGIVAGDFAILVAGNRGGGTSSMNVGTMREQFTTGSQASMALYTLDTLTASSLSATAAYTSWCCGTGNGAIEAILIIENEGQTVISGNPSVFAIAVQ